MTFTRIVQRWPVTEADLDLPARLQHAPPAPPAVMLRRPGFSQILARLSVPQRQVNQLRYLDGYPCDRAAEQMGRTLTSVRWLEYAALRRLYAECEAGPV